MNEEFYEREIVTSGDGSFTIFLPHFNEHYHSHHGAVQESQHVFMKMGWEEAIKGKSSISILEVGFGTGLNAWLVYEASGRTGSPKVHYVSLESFPVDVSMAQQLNYSDRVEEFTMLHTAPWNESVALSDSYTLEKLQCSLLDFVPSGKYDLIFFDAFAPRVQPELWTKDVFDKIFNAMNPDGILVTYCSKGDVRRNMIAAGFTVEKVPGPPGKREMLRARKM